MKRPTVICHMLQSIDGKVTGDFLASPAGSEATELYYELNRSLNARGFACGRVTMEESFTGGFYPDLNPYKRTPVPEGDFLADPDADFFAVSFDRRGRLGWQGPSIVDEDPGYGGAHIVQVLCRKGPKPAYLAYLRQIGVSYIFAGKDELDLPLALHKLSTLFGIRTLLLEGGSVLNGAFEREGLIDELSLVIAPVLAREGDKPLCMSSRGSAFTLLDSQVYDSGVVWMRYGRVSSERKTESTEHGNNGRIF